MAIYRGEVGYEELAGKVMQVATAILYDSGQLEWQNGSLWRFDENGFVDQEYVGANLDAIVAKAFSSDPYHPAKPADWKMQMRRADANSDMMSWLKHPALRKRLDDHIQKGAKHPQIKTSRSLTKISKNGAD